MEVIFFYIEKEFGDESSLYMIYNVDDGFNIILNLTYEIASVLNLELDESKGLIRKKIDNRNYFDITKRLSLLLHGNQDKNPTPDCVLNPAKESFKAGYTLREFVL